MDPTKHAHSHTHSFAYTLLNLHTRQQQSFWRYARFFRKALRIREERSENRVRSVWTLGSNYCAITKIHALEKSPTRALPPPKPHTHIHTLTANITANCVSTKV